MRKRVEVAISDIKKLFSRTIHAVTLEGFLIKLTMYIFGLQMKKFMHNWQLELNKNIIKKVNKDGNV